MSAAVAFDYDAFYASAPPIEIGAWYKWEGPGAAFEVLELTESGLAWCRYLNAQPHPMSVYSLRHGLEKGSLQKSRRPEW